MINDAVRSSYPRANAKITHALDNKKGEKIKLKNEGSAVFNQNGGAMCCRLFVRVDIS